MFKAFRRVAALVLAGMLAMPAFAQEGVIEKMVIDMSAESKAMIEQLGDEMGSRYFREDLFEQVMRPSYDGREAYAELPETDGNGQRLEYENPPRETMYGSSHVYTFAPEGYERILLYVHGGAYVHNAASVHAKTCDLLASELNAKVCVPLYGLAPQAGWTEGYELLQTLWTELTAEGLPVFLMGDSAGGGLALGFAEELAETEQVLPEKLILFSPWVDVTMTDPEIVNYEAVDVSLSVYGLVECGKLWAGELATTDRRISPIYYDHWEKLPETMLFVGTAEIFYPDVTGVAAHMRDAGSSVTLVEGTGLFHVFPVYTSIPEAAESRALIKAFIEG